MHRTKSPKGKTASERLHIALAGEDRLVSLARLKKDLVKASITLGADEARYLVDAYYAMQKDRIADAAMLRAANEAAEPATVMEWMADSHSLMEKQIARVLEAYAAAQVPGQWAMSIIGIGPIIAAGLLAHIDITKAPTAGHIWRFFGLDPTQEWKAKTKRPWNARAKVLAWKAGQSFMKFQNHPNDTYGRIYVARKKMEQERNEAGLFAEQAGRALAKKNFRDDTTAKAFYTQGKLPPAHIDARARRYAVKLFLAHYHHVAYEAHFGTAPPKPYIIEHGGHAHFIAPPNWPMQEVKAA